MTDEEKPKADDESAATPNAEAPEENPAAGDTAADAEAAAEVEAHTLEDDPSDEGEDAPADVEDETPAAEEPDPVARSRGRRRGRKGAAEAPTAEAPAAKPAAKRPAGERPLVRAQAKYVRTSARKARLVCDHIRGKSVEEARAILLLTPRSVSEDWSKLLESAVANAEHNDALDVEDLKIHAVWADEGPTLKRFRPRAMGRATRIRKRTSHLTIQLTTKE